jgi:peptide/nickel transport system ATP-binding protein
MALACRPRILIADEPTTALDVTIQAQILSLLGDLQRELATAVILISHNLGVIAQSVQRVVVMYAGRKVEEAPVAELFRAPRHPYTVGLMGCVPRIVRLAPRARLAEIPGTLPSGAARRRGCAFAPRCALATDQCREQVPPLEEKAPRHFAACWHSQRAGEVPRA